MSVVLGWAINGFAHYVLSLIGLVALSIWAVLEIISGDSSFRRLLGIAVLIGIFTKSLLQL